jgi:hypothetical protein
MVPLNPLLVRCPPYLTLFKKAGERAHAAGKQQQQQQQQQPMASESFD